MYPVGALAPQAANAQRAQLLQQLAAQLQQRRAQQQQQIATPAAGFLDFLKRRQQAHMQGLSAPTQPSGAGSATALTALTAAQNAIGADLRGGLGAAAPRADAGEMSPAYGMPVPNLPGGGLPGGGPGNGVSAPMPAFNAPSALAPTSVPSIMPHSTLTPGASTPTFRGGGLGGVAGPPPGVQSFPNQALPNTPGGFVPIAPGVYLDPTTGSVFGAAGTGRFGAQV